MPLRLSPSHDFSLSPRMGSPSVPTHLHSSPTPSSPSGPSNDSPTLPSDSPSISPIRAAQRDGRSVEGRQLTGAGGHAFGYALEGAGALEGVGSREERLGNVGSGMRTATAGPQLGLGIEDAGRRIEELRGAPGARNRDASTSDYQTIYGSPPLSSIRLPPSTGRPVSISFEQRLTHLSSPTPDLGLCSHHSSASDSSPIPQLSPMGSMSPGSEVGRELGSLEEALEGITLEQREARGRRRREEERQMMRNIDEVQWAKVPPTDQVPRPTFSPALSDTMSFPSTPPPDLYTPPPDLYTPPPHFSSFFNVRTPPPRPARPLTAPPTPATSLTTNDNRLQRTLSTSSQVSLTLTGSRSPGMTDSGRRDSNGKDSKRSSVLLGFVGLAGLGRKNSSRGSLSSSNRSSVLLDTTAPSSSSMTRGPSSNSIASSQSIDEEEEGVVVRTRTSKAAAVLGITDGVLPTNVRRPSSTISKAASSSSSASGEAGKRRGSMGVGGDVGEVLPWFPCARKELVENQLSADTLSQYFAHSSSFIRQRDWRPRYITLTSFLVESLVDSDSFVTTLHAFKSPASLEKETDRLQLTKTSIICVPDDQAGKQFVLKITGLAPIARDEQGIAVRGARGEDTWMLAMDNVGMLKDWMVQLKTVQKDLPASPAAAPRVARSVSTGDIALMTGEGKGGSSKRSSVFGLSRSTSRPTLVDDSMSNGRPASVHSSNRSSMLGGLLSPRSPPPRSVDPDRRPLSPIDGGYGAPVSRDVAGLQSAFQMERRPSYGSVASGVHSTSTYPSTGSIRSRSQGYGDDGGSSVNSYSREDMHSEGYPRSSGGDFGHAIDEDEEEDDDDEDDEDDEQHPYRLLAKGQSRTPSSRMPSSSRMAFPRRGSADAPSPFPSRSARHPAPLRQRDAEAATITASFSSAAISSTFSSGHLLPRPPPPTSSLPETPGNFAFAALPSLPPGPPFPPPLSRSASIRTHATNTTDSMRSKRLSSLSGTSSTGSTNASPASSLPPRSRISTPSLPPPTSALPPPPPPLGSTSAPSKIYFPSRPVTSTPAPPRPPRGDANIPRSPSTRSSIFPPPLSAPQSALPPPPSSSIPTSPPSFIPTSPPPIPFSQSHLPASPSKILPPSSPLPLPPPSPRSRMGFDRLQRELEELRKRASKGRSQTVA